MFLPAANRGLQSGSQPLRGSVQPPQITGSLANLSDMLQTQEYSRKFSSAILSSQTLSAGWVSAPSSTRYTANSTTDHVRPACSQTTGQCKTKMFTTSCSPFPLYESSSCRVVGPLIVPVVHRETDRRQSGRKLPAQTHSSVVPSCSTKTVAVQPNKDSNRPSTASSRVGSARHFKQDDSQKSRERRDGTSNVDATIKQQSYANSTKSVNNNSSSSLQLIDRCSYRPVSRQKVESGSSVAPSQHNVDSVRRIPVALLMQNGSIKSSQFTVKRRVGSHLSSGFVPAASDTADNRNTARSVTPELQTLQPEIGKVMLTDDEQSDAFKHESSCGEPGSIKIENRLISNTPMTVCTLPVSRPAFVCRSLLPETAGSSKPSFSCSKTVTRSYHETTRPQRRESPPVTDSCQGNERRRSATICRLPYVGADLWELTTQRLQRAVIDKVSHGLQNEQLSNAAVSNTSCEVSSLNSPRTPCSLQDAEEDRSDITRLVSKCLSAKTVRPRTALAIRGSQSTIQLLQNCEEEDDDDDDEVVDCDVEL